MKTTAACVMMALAALLSNVRAEGDDHRIATDAIHHLALEMHRQLVGDSTGNLCVSAYSIQTALAMTWAGAAGDTHRQMARVLRFGADEEALHRGFVALSSKLQEGIDQDDAADKESERVILLEANRLFPNLDTPLSEDFIASVRRHYNAGPELLDFVRQPEPARLRINQWVEEQTRDRIKDLIPAGAINPLTRLVLVNALYFKAPWVSPFDKAGELDFHAPEGAVQTAFMQRTGTLGHAAGAGYQRVTIPYKGDSGMQFVIWLPDADSSLTKLEEEFDADWFTAAAATPPALVHLKMPAFKIEGDSVSLKPALITLGMDLPFDQARADFSRMEPTRSLMISDVFHKTFIQVDEQGAEAAAATGVIMAPRSAVVRRPVEILVDRPFLFAIQHRETGAVLFFGRVTKP